MARLTKKKEQKIRRDMKRLFKHTFSGDLLNKVIDDAIDGIKKAKIK